MKSSLDKEVNFATFHPIVIFTYFMCIITITMFSMNPIFLIMTLITSFIYSYMVGGKKAIKFNFILIVPILIFTTIINPLFVHKGVTVLFYLNGNAMTLEAIVYGLASATMLSSVIIWFSAYNKIMTSDKFIYIFGRIMPTIALLLSMCFRFIPMLKNRFKEISEGQKYMGRDYSKGSIFKRVRQLAKEISILIAWSLEVSIETSSSMESRGYGLKGRTSFHIFRFCRRDGIILSIMISLIAIVFIGVISGVNNILYYPAIILNDINWFTALVYVSYLILLLLPILIDIEGELRWRKLNLEM